MLVAGLGLNRLDAQSDAIYLGIDNLERQQFRPIQNQRVGLLTNPAGVNRRGVSTIDVLRRSPRVNLVALFGPEHGIYGDEKANVPVDDRIDPRTGLPVFSLYGRFRRPTPEMLSRIDVMVIDLQDLGVRSYTYVSAMRYTIEECFRHNVAVVVLDRPNPLGGLKVDGPPLDERWMSYVGAFRVPYVHGLTIGELARISKDVPGWLEVGDEIRRRGRLTVVPMSGWTRATLWPQTGLRWVPTSPAIPDLSAALGYSMTGLGAQLGGFQHGYGTNLPFRLLTHPVQTPEQLAATLTAQSIPGVRFEVVTASRLRDGSPLRGVYVVVTDWQVLRPTELSFHMMRLAAGWSTDNPFLTASGNQADLYNKHVGSTAWYDHISTRGSRADVAAWVNRWANEATQFQQWSRRWWLYE